MIFFTSVKDKNRATEVPILVPATLTLIAMHCVYAQICCIMRLSKSTEPLVSALAIDEIRPKVSNKTEGLDASLETYKIAVSSFSMERNWFMCTPFISHSPAAEDTIENVGGTVNIE